TRHDYSAKGLPDRVTPDALPPVAWLTYGSGYLAGMKPGDTPLIDFTRDRLHRETQRRFGEYDLTTAYTPGGQLQSHHLSILQLNRDYTWNSGGQLVRIRGQHEQRDYQYGDAGRLLGTHIQSPHHDLAQWTFTDPAGNRTAQRDKYPMLPDHFRDNRISQDVENFYHYDEHGRLTEKDERRIHPHGSVVHHYRYDNQHRLTHYRRMQQGNVLTESRYLYDPPGRRVSKRVWACTVYHDGSCSQPALQETVWYAWDGNRLTTTQTDKTRIQTVYLPGSFTPLIRIETATGELTRAIRRTLAEKFQQEANVTFPPELVARVDNLEAELRRGELSEANQQWLTQCGLTPEQMKNQLEPEYTPERKIHLYHCDHRGLPLALIDVNGAIAWRAEFDEWGNVLREDNPHNLEQLIRLPGQQWDKETGLYYNRHRYYDPAQGRYITQDPIGLMGGLNPYQYPLNPVQFIDPLGLKDVVAVVWGRRVLDKSVGHVFLGDSNSNVYMSSFPTPHGMHGVNTTKNWVNTQVAEGRTPDGIYLISVPDDDSFDKAAKDERDKDSWDWYSNNANETNCTVQAYKTLKAGGVKLSTPWVAPWSPNDFLDEMNNLSKQKNSGVTKIPMQWWAMYPE
ncbi:TPA: RHS repeat protein, partial [Citrobacter amalonaticus]|nr:RHS repeat protein [Citrobacter amalonaticus]HDT0318088.1 RHS repeat protein [Citrobacter amalonaticus]HED3078943.1 RHS repeat protein [Citrobacter amalonaticus]HED3670402.1 RHS repeat protein [Citrobacter amalonaticus]HED3696008.1 RHS repeat protein [Citrobacter amalonaticus]